MNILNTEINVGLKQPIKLIHASDTHLTLADSRDNERKVSLAGGRKPCFPKNDEILVDIEKYSKKNGFTVLYTGDLIDFVSVANLERAKKFTDECDVFFAAGNHEFSQYVGEAVEDEAYRNQSLDTVQKSFKNDIRFSVRKIGDVKFIAIDNSYYRFDNMQYTGLLKEIESGEPIILLLHNPLFEKELYNISMSKSNGYCAYLVSTPEELMANYTHDRYEQQKADEITLKTTELIKSSPNIKAILCGHLHYDYEGILTDGCSQYVTGMDSIRVLTVY